MLIKRKLFLFQPPIQDFYDTDVRLQPIGLCYLKAAVQTFLPHWQVIIKDYHQGCGRRTVAIPPELAYLKEYYAHADKSPFSVFHHYYHFGAPFTDIARDVATEKPDIVGISVLFSPYYREALQCVHAIKDAINVPIIVGGAHVSADPQGMLAHDVIDFIIQGEGERPLVAFLQAWEAQAGYETVPNLGYKQDGASFLNPEGPNFPIDEIPPPDLTDLDPGRYRYERQPLTFIITSRGCPYHCNFCSVHLTFRERYRHRELEAIFAEICRRYEQGYRVFDFEDDNLTVQKDKIKRLCERLIERFPPGELQLLAMNGLSYHNLDAELLQLMRRAGFTHLNLSLVSSDERVRKRAHRPHSLEKYLEIVAEGARLDYKIVSYQILGLPGENLDSMIQTMTLNAGLPVLLGSSMFYMTPNMPIAADFPPRSERNIFQARLTAMAIETVDFQREDIFTLFITTRIINFLKGLSLSTDMDMNLALTIAGQAGGQSQIGAELLRTLLTEKVLYAAAGSTRKPVCRFRPELFFRVWSGLASICTRTGQKINPAI